MSHLTVLYTATYVFVEAEIDTEDFPGIQFECLEDAFNLEIAFGLRDLHGDVSSLTTKRSTLQGDWTFNDQGTKMRKHGVIRA